MAGPKLVTGISRTYLKRSTTSATSRVIIFIAHRSLCGGHTGFILSFRRKGVEHGDPGRHRRGHVESEGLCCNGLVPFVCTEFFKLLKLFEIVLTEAVDLFHPVVLRISRYSVHIAMGGSYTLTTRAFVVTVTGRNCSAYPLRNFSDEQVGGLLGLPRKTNVGVIVPYNVQSKGGNV